MLELLPCAVLKCSIGYRLLEVAASSLEQRTKCSAPCSWPLLFVAHLYTTHLREDASRASTGSTSRCTRWDACQSYHAKNANPHRRKQQHERTNNQKKQKKPNTGKLWPSCIPSPVYWLSRFEQNTKCGRSCSRPLLFVAPPYTNHADHSSAGVPRIFLWPHLSPAPPVGGRPRPPLNIASHTEYRRSVTAEARTPTGGPGEGGSQRKTPDTSADPTSAFREFA